MSKLKCDIPISLDGFVAGSNQSQENPLGEGGERLHELVFPLAAWRQLHGLQGGEVNESAQMRWGSGPPVDPVDSVGWHYAADVC